MCNFVVTYVEAGKMIWKRKINPTKQSSCWYSDFPDDPMGHGQSNLVNLKTY